MSGRWAMWVAVVTAGCGVSSDAAYIYASSSVDSVAAAQTACSNSGGTFTAAG